tara:strand:- start:1221 stop:1685 length:465 start_codon:yes stop_codon:yes gene_type:complete
MVIGVEKVVPGYIGGITKNPTYQEICKGHTGHAEAILCSYDEKKIILEDILDIFFSTHDPTQLNRQGNDIGTQYRSAIFCINNKQKSIVNSFIDGINHLHDNKIVTEVEINNNFFVAENYHFDYFNRNSENAYCQVVINPKLLKFKNKYKNKII